MWASAAEPAWLGGVMLTWRLSMLAICWFMMMDHQLIIHKMLAIVHVQGRNSVAKAWNVMVVGGMSALQLGTGASTIIAAWVVVISSIVTVIIISGVILIFVEKLVGSISCCCCPCSRSMIYPVLCVVKEIGGSIVGIVFSVALPSCHCCHFVNCCGLVRGALGQGPRQRKKLANVQYCIQSHYVWQQHRLVVGDHGDCCGHWLRALGFLRSFACGWLYCAGYQSRGRSWSWIQSKPP